MLQELIETVQFRDGFCVGGRRIVTHVRINAEAEGLLGPIEHEQRVRQHEVDEGQAEFIARRLGHGRLDAVDVFVAEVAHGAAHETRHTRDLHRPVAGNLGFDESERIVGSRDVLGGATRLADFRRVRETGKNLARTAANETVTRHGIAALDGLEQVSRAGLLELGIRGDRRLEIRHEVGVDGHDIALLTQAQKGFPGRLDVHAGAQRLGTVAPAGKANDREVKLVGSEAGRGASSSRHWRGAA